MKTHSPQIEEEPDATEMTENKEMETSDSEDTENMLGGARNGSVMTSAIASAPTLSTSTEKSSLGEKEMARKSSPNTNSLGSGSDSRSIGHKHDSIVVVIENMLDDVLEKVIHGHGTRIELDKCEHHSKGLESSRLTEEEEEEFGTLGSLERGLGVGVSKLGNEDSRFGDHVIGMEEDESLNDLGDNNDDDKEEGPTNWEAFKQVAIEEGEYYRAIQHAFWHGQVFVLILFSIGAITTGCVSVAFARGISGAEYVKNLYSTNPQYQPFIFLTATLGFLLIYALIHFVFWGTAGSGIPLEMAMMDTVKDDDGSQSQHDCYKDHKSHKIDIKSHELDAILGLEIRKVLSWRIFVGKFLLTLLGVMMGACIGREGPTVQIGSCIFYGFLRLAFRYNRVIRREVLKFPDNRKKYIRAVCLAGGAAGIAAAFSTPMGGILFAIEEMGAHYDRALGKIIIVSVVFAGVTSIGLTGSYRYFGYVAVENETSYDLFVIASLAIVTGGVLGALWSYAMYFFLKLKKRVPMFSRHPFIVTFCVGFVYALLGYFTGSNIYGSGYENAKVMLTDGVTYCTVPPGYENQTNHNGFARNDFVVGPFFGLTKMLGTMLSYLAGIVGGIFSPTLSAGAGWGAMFYCEVVRNIRPVVSPNITVLFFMQAYFSGVTQSPLTSYSILMGMVVFSLDEGSISLEAFRLATALLSAIISRFIMPKSLYGGLADLGIPAIPKECIAPDLKPLLKKQMKDEEETKLENRRARLRQMHEIQVSKRKRLIKDHSWY